jgi:hypothetical protein
MNNNKINITDADLDSIIASIESTIADMTSGNNAIKKAEEDDDMDEKQKEEALAEEMEQAMQNKGQEMQAPEQEEEPQDDQEMQAPKQEEEPQDDQEMQAPKQEEEPQDNSMEENLDQPLSDDELREVYSAMPIDELEKHFMIIREILQSKGGEGSEEQAPAPEAPAMKSENQNSNLSKSQKDKEIALLKAQLNEQTKTLALLTKAFATLAKPERKAITQIAELGYIAKSEASDMQKSLTHEEMSQMYKKLGPSSFSKSENTVIMGYFLKGINKNEAEKILLTKGGKQ